jgi:hypothetical protein
VENGLIIGDWIRSFVFHFGVFPDVRLE